MFKQLSVLILAGCFLLVTSVAFAEYEKVKVIGKVETKFIRTATTGQKKQALEDARREALQKYISSSDNQARARILNNVKDDLYKNIDTYVPEVFPLNDGKWENGYWTIDVEASIDTTQLGEIVNKYSQTNIKKAPKTKMVFIFVAREAKDLTRYKDRETVRSIEGESVTEKSAENENESAAETKRMHEKTTGGSVLKQSAKVSYRSYNSDDLDAKVSEVFTNAKFKAIIPSDLGINRDKFAADFEKGDNVSSSVQQEAVNLARSKNIQYLAVATVDLDQETIDQASGQYKVSAKSKGYVLDLKGEFAEKACSVGPIQISGMGESESIAKTNALIDTGEAMANKLVDQLRVEEGNIE